MSIVYVVRLINTDVWTFQTSIKFHIIRDLETSVALFKYIYISYRHTITVLFTSLHPSPFCNGSAIKCHTIQ